ncbi:hypothetical protein [Streptomyces sp. NPDC046759]|uniref:hypothetical protein n=1 Tax=Streptomyces sp. NPDC046759 TaxID=3155019 RepID=UPI0033EFE092
MSELPDPRWAVPRPQPRGPPLADVTETDDAFEVEIYLAGVKSVPKAEVTKPRHIRITEINESGGH